MNTVQIPTVQQKQSINENEILSYDDVLKEINATTENVYEEIPQQNTKDVPQQMQQMQQMQQTQQMQPNQYQANRHEHATENGHDMQMKQVYKPEDNMNFYEHETKPHRPTTYPKQHNYIITCFMA